MFLNTFLNKNYDWAQEQGAALPVPSPTPPFCKALIFGWGARALPGSAALPASAVFFALFALARRRLADGLFNVWI